MDKIVPIVKSTLASRSIKNDNFPRRPTLEEIEEYVFKRWEGLYARLDNE